MKLKLILMCFMILLLAPITVKSQQTASSIEKLDDLSDEALQMVKFQKYEEAKKLLDYFSEQFPVITETGRPLTMDELRIVTVSRDQALEAAASSNMKYEERISRLTKFRLVIDALSSKHQPLWTGMEDQIMETFQQVKAAAYKGDQENFHTNFNSFLSLYNVIYPSMKIDVPAESIQKLDARINFVDRYRSQMVSNPKNIKELDALELDLKKMFHDMEEDEADPSLWWVIISTGSIIILTLSYVGFRKYQGEKNMKKNRTREYKD